MDLIASLCERVIVLAEGSVLTEGPMDAVRRDPRVIDAYLGGGEEDRDASRAPSGRGRRRDSGDGGGAGDGRGSPDGGSPDGG